MNKKIDLNDITIRTHLGSGDIGYIIYLHGILYSREYDYGLAFESYVAEGLSEFYQNFSPEEKQSISFGKPLSERKYELIV